MKALHELILTSETKRLACQKNKHLEPQEITTSKLGPKGYSSAAPFLRCWIRQRKKRRRTYWWVGAVPRASPSWRVWGPLFLPSPKVLTSASLKSKFPSG